MSWNHGFGQAFRPRAAIRRTSGLKRNIAMGGIIYLVGLVVVVMFVLSLLGLS